MCMDTKSTPHTSIPTSVCILEHESTSACKHSLEVSHSVMAPDAERGASQAVAADQPTAPYEVHMLQLPIEVLHMLYKKLNQRSQHALRCTCRAMQQASSSVISELRVVVGVNHQQANNGADDNEAHSMELVQQSIDKVQRFPKDARLLSMLWRATVNKDSYDDEADRLAVLPAALPTFFLAVSAKLVHITELTLSGSLAIGYGETSVLATTCPQLCKLTIDSPIIGPAFTPLSSLRSLKQLSLVDGLFPHGVSGVCPALLSLLSILTSLEVYDHTSVGEQHLPVCPKHLAMEDILVQLQQQQQQPMASFAVQELSLSLRWQQPDCLDSLSSLSALTQLTSLTLSTPRCDGHPSAATNAGHLITATGPAAAVTTLQQKHLATLASISQLASLTLDYTVLSAETAVALAAAPHLTSLEVLQLHVSTELSGVPCSWRRLVLHHECQPLSDLTLLPLSSIEELELRGRVTWRFNGSEGLDAAVGQLANAAGIIARLCQQDLQVSLHWDGTPPANCSRALAGLAPLRGYASQYSVSLYLAESWLLCKGVVEQLHMALGPKLFGLDVWTLGAGFQDLVAALATQLSGLRRLFLRLPASSTTMPSSHLFSLLGMAVASARAGMSLHVFFSDNLSQDQCQDCNRVLEAHGGGNGVRFFACRMLRQSLRPGR